MSMCLICREEIAAGDFKVPVDMSCCGNFYHLQCVLSWFSRIHSPSCTSCGSSYNQRLSCSECCPENLEEQEWLYILKTLYTTATGQAEESTTFNAAPEIASCFLNKCSQLASSAIIPCEHALTSPCNKAFAIFSVADSSTEDQRRARKKILQSIFSLTAHSLTIAAIDGEISTQNSFEDLLKQLARKMRDPSYGSKIARLVELPENPRGSAILPSRQLTVPYTTVMQQIFALNENALQKLFQQNGLENLQQLIAKQSPIVDANYLPNCIGFNMTTEQSTHRFRPPVITIKNIFVVAGIIYIFILLLAYIVYKLAYRMQAPASLRASIKTLTAALIYVLTHKFAKMNPRTQIRLATGLENNLAYLILLAAMLMGVVNYL